MGSKRRMRDRATGLGAALLLMAGLVWAPADAQDLADDELYRLGRMVVFGTEGQSREALIRLRRRGGQDVVPPLILALRYGSNRNAIDQTLAALTGDRGRRGWNDWMIWQQGQNDLVAEDTYLRLKLDVLTRIDRRFNRFFNHRDLAHDIRLEEVAWRGLSVDDVAALTDPRMDSATTADGYLSPDELVLGVELNGDARAYPLRILDWHEVINDVVGNTPVTVAYCPLCGTGVMYATRVEGREVPIEFGSSGLVYRSRQLVYDVETDSLWDLFSGRPVIGPLTGSGIELSTLPIVMTRWADWHQRHPDTQVLSPVTGYDHPYIPGAAHAGNANSPDPLFPVAVTDYRMAPKELVFGIRLPEGAKAWPIDTFAGGAVINDSIGPVDVVLIGDAESRTVRAYRRDGHVFSPSASPRVLYTAEQQVWRVSEEMLLGPNGAKLPRLPGLTAYWFAWSGYVGQRAALYALDSVPTD